MKYRYLLQFISGLIVEIILGIISVLFGSYIGGNFGFVEFGGNRGYEAGGAFFGSIGLVLGALYGVSVVKRFLKEKVNIRNSLIGAVIIIFLFLLIFKNDSPPICFYPFLVLNPILFILLSKEK